MGEEEGVGKFVTYCDGALIIRGAWDVAALVVAVAQQTMASGAAPYVRELALEDFSVSGEPEPAAGAVGSVVVPVADGHLALPTPVSPDHKLLRDPQGKTDAQAGTAPDEETPRGARDKAAGAAGGGEPDQRPDPRLEAALRIAPRGCSQLTALRIEGFRGPARTLSRWLATVTARAPQVHRIAIVDAVLERRGKAEVAC
jgi:hypothetical protein